MRFIWTLLVLALVGDVARWPGAMITWSTANEINVAGYIVERADDAAGPWTWASNLVVAEEDVLAWNDYRFVDSGGAGHWYRLTVVNLKNARTTLGVIAP